MTPSWHCSCFSYRIPIANLLRLKVALTLKYQVAFPLWKSEIQIQTQNSHQLQCFEMEFPWRTCFESWMFSGLFSCFSWGWGWCHLTMLHLCELSEWKEGKETNLLVPFRPYTCINWVMTMCLRRISKFRSRHEDCISMFSISSSCTLHIRLRISFCSLLVTFRGKDYKDKQCNQNSTILGVQICSASYAWWIFRNSKSRHLFQSSRSVLGILQFFLEVVFQPVRAFLFRRQGDQLLSRHTDFLRLWQRLVFSQFQSFLLLCNTERKKGQYLLVRVHVFEKRHWVH